MWGRGSSDTFKEHTSKGSNSITFVDPLANTGIFK
jgi:hypothetical protein